MRLLHFLSAFVLVTVGCGGESSTLFADGGPDAGDAATTSDAPQTPDVGPPTEAGLPCPDERGAYSVQLSGLGCGDTSTSVTECIQQTQCSIQLDFGGGSGKGLKGQTPIGSDGSFTNASIEEGSTTRTGCSAKWDQQTRTLVVDCGGENTPQSCIATLTRTGDVCN